ALACGCGPEDGAGRESRDRAAALQRLLERQSTAVRNGNERDYLAAVDPRAGKYRAAQRRVFRNLRRLPLTQWAYRIADVRYAKRDGHLRARADVRLRYRLRDDDRVPVTATERLAFAKRDGRWFVTAELPDSDRQLWEQGEITVVRGERSLVLGVGRTREGLRSLARDADRAVSAVDEVWPRDWPRRTVLEAPGSLRRMAQLLDASASTYEGIAAVTTGEAGESTEAPADRIVVNPEAYGRLSEEGQQVVVTHETVHVATRTHTGPATPLWLSEGLADWVGYRGTGRMPRDAAPELRRAVEEGDVPRDLPSDRAFRFGSEPEALGRAYESGWLACRFMARTWGEEKLLDFYQRVGKGKKDSQEGRASVDRAMEEVFGLSLDRFTERWRAYLRDELA
ncbi:MAG: hypothetical protein ACRDOV_14985, partial [Streptomyces sp.]